MGILSLGPVWAAVLRAGTVSRAFATMYALMPNSQIMEFVLMLAIVQRHMLVIGTVGSVWRVVPLPLLCMLTIRPKCVWSNVRGHNTCLMAIELVWIHVPQDTTWKTQEWNVWEFVLKSLLPMMRHTTVYLIAPEHSLLRIQTVENVFLNVQKKGISLAIMTKYVLGNVLPHISQIRQPRPVSKIVLQSLLHFLGMLGHEVVRLNVQVSH